MTSSADLYGRSIRGLWENVMTSSADTYGRSLRGLWENVMTSSADLYGRSIRGLWENVMTLQGLYSEKCEKIFLSETTRPRVLIFGMKHHLVDLYQVCLNYIPRAKNGPVPGVICFT